MLIPTQIAKNVGKVAAKESTRYAINGVLIQRKDDHCIAAATDGRMLLKVKWQDDDRGEYPPMVGISNEPKEGFSTLVGPKELAEVAKMAPRRSPHRILERIALEEQGNNGTVTFGATDLSNVQTRRVQVVEGHFPNHDDVIPRYRVGYDAVEVGVSPELLCRLLTAMEGAAMSCDNKGIRMTVPINPAKPIVLDSQDKSERVDAIGVIMPVGLTERRGDNKPIQHAERLADELGKLVHLVQAMQRKVRESPNMKAVTVLMTDEVVQTVNAAQHTLEMAGCWAEPTADGVVEAMESEGRDAGSSMAQAA